MIQAKPTLDQRRGGKGGGDRDHSLNAVVVQKVSQQEFQRFRKMFHFAKGLAELFEAHAGVGVTGRQLALHDVSAAGTR